MPIANFNPQDFGKNLAQQAIEVIPKDLGEESKKYVVNKVYQFCVLAGNALNQDPNITLNSDQACIITQFIGEWTFHKSIDMIRANIPQDCWDPILQQVAFAVFEMAKQAQINGANQNQAAAMIEKEVLAAYEKSLRELAQSGKIKEAEISEILNHSNIDQMTQESGQPVNMSKEEEDRALKYASIALLLKSLPEKKVEKILSSLDPQEAAQLQNYIRIPDLEHKLDATIASQFLTEFKTVLNHKKAPAPHDQVNYFKGLTDLYTEQEIMNVIRFERQNLKEFISYCLKHNQLKNSRFDYSPYVSKIVYDYLRQKLTA